jgi:hypothetical protein
MHAIERRDNGRQASLSGEYVDQYKEPVNTGSFSAKTPVH